MADTTTTTTVPSSTVDQIFKTVTDLGQQFGLLQQTVNTQTADVQEIKQEAASTGKSQSNVLLYVGIIVAIFLIFRK